MKSAEFRSSSHINITTERHRKFVALWMWSRPISLRQQVGNVLLAKRDWSWPHSQCDKFFPSKPLNSCEGHKLTWKWTKQWTSYLHEILANKLSKHQHHSNADLLLSRVKSKLSFTWRTTPTNPGWRQLPTVKPTHNPLSEISWRTSNCLFSKKAELTTASPARWGRVLPFCLRNARFAYLHVHSENHPWSEISWQANIRSYFCW